VYRKERDMMRIERAANGHVILTVSGRMDAENLIELKNLIDSEAIGHSIVLDLKDLTLVDRDAVRFLEQCDSDGIWLRNCPPYIREWIARERDGR
jgi:anti-anti-sigma regulatory factor